MQYNLNDKAEILMETLPFMRRYSNKVIVIKFGGHAMGQKEYVKTLIHEFTHVRQTVDGITDSNAREDEAYYLEEQLSKAFWDNNISGTQDVDL